MKCTIKKKTWQAIYRLLDRVSPIDEDCGKLCNSICCTCENTDKEMVIFLYPGEEKVHSRKDDWLEWTVEPADYFDFPDSWIGNIYFVKCKTPPVCPREKRPFQCRTYPLTPYLTESGELLMIYNDDDLPYECPLIEEEIPLNDSFVKATHTAWSHLLRDPYIRDLIEMDSRQRDAEANDYYDEEDYM